MKELGEKVQEVHNACGYDAEHDPDTLQMLGAIEAKLEEFLAFLEEAEQIGEKEKVEALEKQKELDRRNMVKRQKKEKTDRFNEKRLKVF